MNRALQGFLLLLYRAVSRTGLLSTRVGRRLFARAYSLYKRRLEAGDIRLLRPFVAPGSAVVDVGANIGEFTLEFARWVGPDGRVHAFEPESTNYRHLLERLEEAGVEGRVAAVEAAVADEDGELRLLINRQQPADHRLAETGVPVAAVALDSYLARAEHRPVSLIKIDVQGAELQVLAGARATLGAHRPALFVEVADACLREFGGDARALLDDLTGLGYRIHRLLANRVSDSIDLETALSLQEAEGYVDLLFLAEGQDPSVGASERR